MKYTGKQILSLFWQKPRTLVLLLLLTTIYSCNNGDESLPDVSNIKVSINSRRLDLDLGKIDTSHIGQGLQKEAIYYPDFINFYLDTLMGFGINGNYNDSAIGVRQNLRTFLTHKDFRGVFDTVAKRFPDVKAQDVALEKGFKYMKYYFPQFKEPKIIYFVTGLRNWSSITYGNDIIGVGLDMALGPKYPNYSRVDIPDYVIRNLVPESIPVNVFRSLYTLDHPFITENRDLLDMIIQKGKEQYFLSKVIPFVPDSLRLGFSGSQLDWCKENEAGIYNYFGKAQLLYETQLAEDIKVCIRRANAAGMAPESPGNVGSWMGWQIIRAYMKEHPETTMEQLFAMQDAQKILQSAHYKPR